jgi:pyruvate/2-oxoglutarate dehydrogenase complex dihydrolipoamide acyltransferase (E2) component
MVTKVTLPQTGEGVIEATVTRWLKKEGDEVKEYDPLVEINTDKVDTEIPSPVTGTVLKILAAEGATAPVNSILAWIGKPGEAIPADGGGAARRCSCRRHGFRLRLPIGRAYRCRKQSEPGSRTRHWPRRPHHQR